MSLAVQCAVAAARPAVARAQQRRRGALVVCQAGPKTEEKKGPLGLGDVLGPIGLTVGKDVNLETGEEQPAAKASKPKKDGAAQMANRLQDAAGMTLGPIGITVGGDLQNLSLDDEDGAGGPSTRPESYASLTTEEWRALYEKDGYVDLWVAEEFNAGSRIVGGSAAYRGMPAGYRSGEGPGVSTAPRHKVKIINHYADQEVEVEVPEDRYVLYAAEDEGLELPYACRLGCCTSCTVKVLEGAMYQPHSLGLSKGLREQGYALMCVGYPLSDLVLETVPEDEAYELQFGRTFAEYGSDPNAPSVERDDFAIELAMLDE